MEIKRGGVVSRLLEDVPLPRMFRARQDFPRPVIPPQDIPAAVARELSREPFRSKLRPGMEVAITAGSRGIANVALITRSIVDFVRSCRLKPHNAFRGPYESGPCKMMTVGLGKQRGAERVHADGMGRIAQNIPSMARVVLEKAPILFAIPCMENAYDETCRIEAIDRDDIMDREPELLKYAFSQMPSLLVGSCDVLVVDETGKNYSGTGVDPNITGTFSTEFAHGSVEVQRTCFLDLSEASHGNSLGVGLASVITKRFFDKIDLEMMYPNCITSTVLASARIPCVVATDKEAIQMCVRTCNGIDQTAPRIIRIPNSLHIGQIMLSESYYADALAGRWPGVVPLSPPEELRFDSDGALLTPIVL